MKGKWRRLHWIDVDNLRYLNYWILTACCLHNFVLDIPFFGRLEENLEQDDEDDEDDENEERENLNAAHEKRNQIAAFFNHAPDIDSD